MNTPHPYIQQSLSSVSKNVGTKSTPLKIKTRLNNMMTTPKLTVGPTQQKEHWSIDI